MRDDSPISEYRCGSIGTSPLGAVPVLIGRSMNRSLRVDWQRDAMEWRQAAWGDPG